MKVPLKKPSPSIKNNKSIKTKQGLKFDKIKVGCNISSKLEDSLPTAFDIILGKVTVRPESIDDFTKILRKYEKECCQQSRYVEAEMAKHKIEEISKAVKKFKVEKATNDHLKERLEVEEALMAEVSNFKDKWRRKQLKFEAKIEENQKEMKNHHYKQLEEAKSKVEERFLAYSKESNKKISNLQKIEKACAQQRAYIEAQKAREEWLLEKEKLASQIKEETEKRKTELIAEFELRSKREIEEFVLRVNDMRVALEAERQGELDNLLSKYERVKSQLSSIQLSELKRLRKLKDFNSVSLNDSQSIIQTTRGLGNRKDSVIESKKKVLMKQINKLNIH